MNLRTYLMIKSAAGKKTELLDNPLKGTKWFWGGSDYDANAFLKGGYNDPAALLGLGKNRITANNLIAAGYDQATIDKLLKQKGVSTIDFYINPRTGKMVPKLKRTWGKYAPGGAAGGAALGALAGSGLESALGIDDDYGIGTALGAAGGGALGAYAPGALEQMIHPQQGVLHTDISLGDKFRLTRGGALQRKGNGGVWKDFGKKVFKKW